MNIMKTTELLRVVLATVCLLCRVSGVEAQNFVTGQRMPRLNSQEWLGGKPELKRSFVLVEFFSSNNATVMSHVDTLNRLAEEYDGRMEVVVVSKDPAEVMEQVFGAESGCHVAVDGEGRLFDAFGVRFVPCTMLLDQRGRVAWSGNPMTVGRERIEELIR